jgi:hypothetical protein
MDIQEGEASSRFDPKRTSKKTAQESPILSKSRQAILSFNANSVPLH